MLHLVNVLAKSFDLHASENSPRRGIMKIHEIGGEFKLLDRLRKQYEEEFGVLHNGICVGNGDDSAIVAPSTTYRCLSVDTFVQDRHFSFQYFPPLDVGKKVVESAASDLIAMRARPEYLLVALTLPDECEVEQVEEVYKGIAFASKRLGCLLVGGDLTSHQNTMVISVTVLGSTLSKDISGIRSGAKPGERVYVTGSLGGSTAGLKAFQQDLQEHQAVKECHLSPQCRIDSLDWPSDLMSSCIDISDGLSNETQHIANASGIGIVIDANRIPINSAAKIVAKELGEDALDYALNGGEDFELLFTSAHADRVPKCCVEIGRVVQESGVWLERDGDRTLLEPGGSNRFLRRGGV